MATCATNKIDSNVTGLRYAEEECPKILPASPVWNPLEPNTYNDFGGQVTSVARAPINPSRQRQEGSPTDLDASGGINQDLTQDNLQDLLQGFMFADTRTKSAYSVTGAAGDLEIVVAPDSFPTLVSTVLDLTTLGLIPGEWIYIGGDTSASAFAANANNGFKRIRSIDENVIVFDKSVQPMVADDGAGKTIMLYFGDVLKNEADPALIKRRTYQLERTLGSLDGLQPSQSEYLVGASCNEFSLNLATADKVTVDMSFVGMDFEQRTQADGYKPGSRPPLASGAMINTSSDFKRIKLSIIEDDEAVPTPLFAFLQEGTITINNGITPNKAIGVFGAFDTSAADFVVSGTLTAYFADIRAVQAVRNSARCTMDAVVVKGTTGMVLDIPLVKLGDGRANVTKDEPITLPLNLDAATAAALDPDLDYTLMWVFFNNLPARAGANP
nr:major structural protein [Achromobacter phage vB_Ade_ART]